MIREDCRLMCGNSSSWLANPCTRVIPKKAKAGYTCPCGKRHLFLPMDSQGMFVPIWAPSRRT